AGQAFGVDLLLHDRRVSRAAADGEVVRAERDATPVDLTEAEHEVRRHDADRRPVLGPRGEAGERPDLLEAALVEQVGDPLTDGAAAVLVLTADLVLAAERLGSLQASSYLIDLIGPDVAHGVPPS